MTRLLTRQKRATIVLSIVFLSHSTIFAAHWSLFRRSVNGNIQQRKSGWNSNRLHLVEEFSFLIKDFKINHQGETNTLNITIRYQYKQRVLEAEYPDFRLIVKDVESFLSNYPNESDYWEILNKKITLLILNKYSAIAKITSDMHVSPSRNDPYNRSSIVIRERSR